MRFVEAAWPLTAEQHAATHTTAPAVGSAPRSRKFRGENVGHIDSSSTGGPDFASPLCRSCSGPGGELAHVAEFGDPVSAM